MIFTGQFYRIILELVFEYKRKKRQFCIKKYAFLVNLYRLYIIIYDIYM